MVYWNLYTGFSVFFSMFELTRRTAISLKDSVVQQMNKREDFDTTRSHIPRIVHGSVLVSGGILAGGAYELVGRPFDVARRTVYLHRVAHPHLTSSAAATKAILDRARDEGLHSFFRAPVSHHEMRTAKNRLYSALRVLGRMGPWGAGFLIWEAFGPGLAT